jgi:hypothetical protein
MPLIVDRRDLLSYRGSTAVTIWPFTYVPHTCKRCSKERPFDGGHVNRSYRECVSLSHVPVCYWLDWIDHRYQAANIRQSLKGGSYSLSLIHALLIFKINARNVPGEWGTIHNSLPGHVSGLKTGWKTWDNDPPLEIEISKKEGGSFVSLSFTHDPGATVNERLAFLSFHRPSDAR